MYICPTRTLAHALTHLPARFGHVRLRRRKPPLGFFPSRHFDHIPTSRQPPEWVVDNVSQHQPGRSHVHSHPVSSHPDHHQLYPPFAPIQTLLCPMFSIRRPAPFCVPLVKCHQFTAYVVARVWKRSHHVPIRLGHSNFELQAASNVAAELWTRGRRTAGIETVNK